MAGLGRTRIPVALGAAVALVVVAASTSWAAGMITAKETGSFTVGSAEIGYPVDHTFDVSIEPGSLVDSGIARLAAGASFGWHYHTAAVVVTIVQGELSLYDPSCDREVVSAGHGFIEQPGVVHLARNEGSSVVVLAFTYLGVPAGQPEDVSEPAGYAPCGDIQ